MESGSDYKRLEDELSSLEMAMLEGQELPDDISELKMMLGDDGVDLSDPKVTEALAERLDPVRVRQEAEKRKKRARPKYFDKIRNFALTSRDAIALFMNFLLMALLPFVGMILLFVSEFLSVGLGISTFLSHGIENVVAWVLAFTVVAFFFALEMRYAALLYQYRDEDVAYRFSLAMLWRRLKYFFNLNSDLEIKKDGHQLRETRMTARWTMVLIVLMGVLGRLADELNEYHDSAWYEGFLKVVVESNPEQFLEYLGGALVAYVLLLGTRFLIHMNYEHWVRIGGNDDESFFDEFLAERELEEMRRLFYQSLIRNRFKRKRTRLMPKYQAYLKSGDTPLLAVEPGLEQEDPPADSSGNEQIVESVNPDETDSMNE